VRGTIILADGLQPAGVVLASQSGGDLSVASNTVVQDPALGFGVLSNSGTGQTVLEVGANTGLVWSRGPVTVRNGARVHGDVHGGGTVTLQGGTVDGTITRNETIPTRVVTLDVFFPTSTDSRDIDRADDLALDPGAYQVFNVNRGGLVLRTGSYFFDALTFNSGTRLLINNPNGGVISVFVRGPQTASFLFRGTQQLTAGQLSAFRVVCFGTADVSLESVFTGTVAAPNATIRPQTAATFTGAFLGRSVVTQSGQTFNHAGFPAWEPAV
jgi:hypothetical protein